MATIKVMPRFNAINRTLAFPSKELNYFTAELIQDNFDYYQRAFGVFSFMKLTSSLKFIISTITGNPMLWTAHNACAWEPNAVLGIGKREITPSKVKINAEQCYDELFDSAYEDFLRWDGRSALSLSQSGEVYLQNLITTITQNAALGARLALTVGNKYDPDAVTFKAETPGELRDLFSKTITSTNGYMKLLSTMAASASKYAHLNLSSLFSADDLDGKKYVGDVINLFDSLKDNAPSDLEAIINEGGSIAIAGDSNAGRPLVLVSSSIFNAIVSHYNKNCISLTCTNPRVTKESVIDGTRTYNIYYIDMIPVIPMSDVNYYDKYLTGATHFMAITTSGNINLGTAWDNMPDPNSTSNDVGLLIERSTRVQDFGKTYMAGHNLLASGISETDQIVAAQIYAEPA